MVAVESRLTAHLGPIWLDELHTCRRSPHPHDASTSTSYSVLLKPWVTTENVFGWFALSFDDQARDYETISYTVALFACIRNE